MSSRKGGLQKNIRNIFKDATLSDELYARPASEETAPTPSAAVVTPEEECPTEVELDQPQSDVVTESPVSDEPIAAPTPTSTPEPAPEQVEPEAQLTTEPEPDQDDIDPMTSSPPVEPASVSHAAPEQPEFHDRTIEGQKKKQRCEKGFSCYASGLKELCKARVIRRGKAVQCLEPKKKPCEYRISTFFKKICQCPIRIYIAKKHKK